MEEIKENVYMKVIKDFFIEAKRTGELPYIICALVGAVCGTISVIWCIIDYL